jgi:hypothetical protein
MLIFFKKIKWFLNFAGNAGFYVLPQRPIQQPVEQKSCIFARLAS